MLRSALLGQWIERWQRTLCRFRHPVSLPEEVAQDLGVVFNNNISFKELVEKLSHCASGQKFSRFMQREKAENYFKFAQKKERFHSTTLFSYYFSEGWLVVVLHFDGKARLRRLNIQCPFGLHTSGFDLPLSELYSFAL